MQVANIDGVKYHIRNMTATRGLDDKEISSRTCGLTRKLIREGDAISLVINNSVAFPNKWILTDALEEMGVEAAMRHLKQRYDRYRAFKNEFREWA